MILYYEYNGNMLGIWLLLGIIAAISLSFLIYHLKTNGFFKRKRKR
jgi:hypothetical protein